MFGYITLPSHRSVQCMSMTEETHTSTQAPSTYRLTEEDRELILSQVTSAETFISSSSIDGNDVTARLESLRRKETTLSLHLSTLVEYIKANRIPRGLRTSLTPNLLTDDNEFVSHWYGMCNQFSQDLMLLTVKHLQERLNLMKVDIEKTEEELANKLTTDKCTEAIRSIESVVSKLKENILKTKTRKFERDAKDYELNEVYTWQKKRRAKRRPSPPHSRPQTSRNIAADTSTSDSEGSGTSDSRRPRRSFLQRTRPTPTDTGAQRPQTRAWSGRGRGRGRGTTKR